MSEGAAVTFSVVIAAFEAEQTIGEAIASVQAQTRSDFEVIVIDDGSRDRTADAVGAIAARDARVRLRRQRNGGPSAARNLGISLARGEFVCILDSDDLWLPNYLAEMGRALGADPYATLAYTDAWVLDERSGRFEKETIAARRRHPPGPTLPHEEFLGELLERNFIFGSVTVRREVFDHVGGYDPGFTRAEDYGLWLRIALAGFKAVRVPGPLAIWRARSHALSADGAAMVGGLRAVYESVLRRDPLEERTRRIAIARLHEVVEQERELRVRPGATLRMRDKLAAATRARRRRWRLRPAPPPSVAHAFPGLGFDSETSSAEPDAAAGGQAEDATLAGFLPEPEEAAPRESLTGTVARGIGLAGAGFALSQVLTFGGYLVLARLLTPSDFGHYAAGSVIVGLGTVVGESGMLAALIQRRGKLEEALNSAFLATLAGGVGLSLLALALAPVLGLFFRSHTVTVVAAAMSGWMLLRLLAIVPDAILQRRFSFMRRTVIDPLSTLAFAAGAVTAASLGMGVWSLVIGTYASALLTVGSGWAFAGWRPRPARASMRTWRELGRFGRPVVSANLVHRFVEEVPVLVIGRVIGSAALGQFTYALRVAAQPLGAVVNVGGYVLLPAFSRLSADEERFRAAVRRALRWLCIASFPLGMLLVPLGLPAVVLVFGHQFREAGEAAMALGAFAAALSLDAIATEAWKAAGRTDMLLRMHSVALVLTVVSVLALVPLHLVGVALGLSLSALGVAAFAVRGMSSALGISRRALIDEIWPPALAAIAMAGALLCFERFVLTPDHYAILPGLLLLALEALLGVALYAALLGALAPRSRRELLALVGGRLRGIGAGHRSAAHNA